MKTTLLLAAATISSAAHAEDQERRSPLADAPAIRHKSELRDLRLEIGAGIGSTVGQDFYQAILVGPKLAFHLTDWLAIGGSAQFNIAKDMKTSFAEELEKGLKKNVGKGRTPPVASSFAAMNKISQVYGIHAELIPFAGKLGLFNKLFASYDFYGFGGVGFINFEAGKETCTPQFCPNVGMKAGASFGLGFRTYFNDTFALNVEARDVLLRNNPAGRDVNGDTVANSKDLTWDSNYIATVNIMVFLPTKARLSD